MVEYLIIAVLLLASLAIFTVFRQTDQYQNALKQWVLIILKQLSGFQQ